MVSAPTPRGPDYRVMPPAGPMPEYIALAHNALPALIAAARLTVPEPIGEKHRDGRDWLCCHAGTWKVMRWKDWGGWMDEENFNMLSPTHALPMPPMPEAPDA